MVIKKLIRTLILCTILSIIGASIVNALDNYNYYIKNDGGSLSPVVRLVTLKDGRIKYNQRRNVFEIQFVMLG